MKKVVVWLVVLAVLAVCGWAVYDVFLAGGKERKSNVERVTEAVGRRDFLQTVLATGTVKAEVGAQVNVGARVSGKVEQLTAAIGDKVRKDQVIARIEHEDLAAQVAQRKSQLDYVQAQIKAEQERVVAELASADALIEQRRRELETSRKQLVAITEQRQRELDAEQERLRSIDEQRAAEIKLAEAQILEAKATHTFAAKDVQRMKALYEKDMVAEQTLDKAVADVETTQSRWDTAREGLAVAKTRRTQELAVQNEVVSKAKAALINDVDVQLETVEKARAALGVAKQGKAAVEKTSETTLAVLNASLPRLQSELHEAEIKLSYAEVKAPIAGVIGTISTQEGETVAAGFNAPTFVTVVDLTRLQVDAYVDEVDIGKVAVGQKASFTVDAFREVRFKGTVVAIYPTAILLDNVVYYDVVLRIDTEFVGRLRPEMTANVVIETELRKDSIAVPAPAVHREGSDYFVFVKTDSGEEKRAVETGLEEDDWTEIRSGLEPGEVVIYEKRVKPKREGGDR